MGKEELHIHAETLIALIEKYEAIWNVKSADYENENLRNKAWEEITYTICEENKIIITPDMRRLVQKRWKNIRDHFKRYVRSLESGEGCNKVPYVHAERLKFLNGIVNFKRAPSSFQLQRKKKKTSFNLTSPKNSNVEEQTLQSLDFSKIPTAGNDNENFLLSLLPSLESLPRSLNMQCRIEILQLLQKFNEFNEPVPN